MVSEFLNKIVFTVFNAIIQLIVKFVLEPIINFVTTFVISILSYYFYQISVVLLSVVDLLSDFFQLLAGVELYGGNPSKITFEGLNNFFVSGETVDNAGGDLLFQLLVSQPVMETFLSVMVVGIFLTLFSSMVMIIKQEFDPDKPNNKMKVLGTALKSFLYMIFVPVICIMGVFLSNEVLQLIHVATSDDKGATISGMIFTSAAQNAGYKTGEMFISLEEPISAAITAGLNIMIEGLTNDASMIKADKDDLLADSQNGSVISAASMKEIMESYIYIGLHEAGAPSDGKLMTIFIGTTQKAAFTELGALKIIKEYDSSVAKLIKKDASGNESGSFEGKSKTADSDKTRLYVGDGSYITNTRYFKDKKEAKEYAAENNAVCVYDPEEHPYRTYYNSFQVSKDFNATKINYLVLIVASAIIIKALASASVALIMRLYKAVAFFLILPGVLGLGPMDGGSTFNNWKKTFVGEVIAAYGFIIAVNLYLFLAPLVQNISLSYTPTNYSPSFFGVGGGGAELIVSSMNLITNSEMAASILRMIFIISGALMIEKLASTISGFIGGVDLASIGKSMLTEVGKTASTGFSVGTKLTVGAMATSATMFGGIAHKIGKEHRTMKEHGGLIKGNALARGFNKIRGGATAEERAQTKATKGGLVKRGVGALGQGVKSVGKGIGTGAENLFYASMGKGGKSMKYAKANFMDAEKGFKEADIAYAKAKEAYDADPSKENQDKLSAADQKRDMALDKYKKETKKYENTASAVSKGSFKNAGAAAGYALNTVLDSLPGADIAKGLWSQHKEAQDQVDKRSEENTNRADDLKQFAKEIKDKIGEKTPLGMMHIASSNNQLMKEIEDLTQTHIVNAEREKRKMWKQFTEALARVKGNPAEEMRIKEAATNQYLTNEAGELLSEEELNSQLQVYQKIPMQIKQLKKNGAKANEIISKLEKVFKEEAKASNKPIYKDLMKLIQDIQSGIGK